MLKVMPTMMIWVISLCTMIVFAEDMSTVFWIAFAVFCGVSIYIERNRKRLFKDEDY